MNVHNWVLKLYTPPSPFYELYEVGLDGSHVPSVASHQIELCGELPYAYCFIQFERNTRMDTVRDIYRGTWDVPARCWTGPPFEVTPVVKLFCCELVEIRKKILSTLINQDIIMVRCSNWYRFYFV